jgi:hypothetical protein
MEISLSDSLQGLFYPARYLLDSLPGQPRAASMEACDRRRVRADRLIQTQMRASANLPMRASANLHVRGGANLAVMAAIA